MIVCAKTDVGKTRKNNEDSIFSSLEAVGCFENLFVVADGMGGHNAGEIASSLAIEYIKEYLENNTVDLDTQGIIMDSIFSANHKIFEKSRNELNKRGMGTTVTMATVRDGSVYIGHVGDSRAYSIKNNRISQLTYDHTYVNEMVQKGLMTREQALVDPNRNMITRAVGIDATVMVDFFERKVEKGEYILICSDGLHGLVNDEILLETVMFENSLEEKCGILISKAIEKGGTDNISVVLINI